MVKKIYFASDFHLGIDAGISSYDREIMLVRWLSDIENDAEEIFLLGDIFDYWFDYREVVPKGFTLLLGKLKYLRLKGIPIYFFTGNHDMWVFDYFEKELDIPTFRKPLIKFLNEKKFYLAHGDGLGNVKFRDKLMKTSFANPLLQWLFARIHPNTGLAIMRFFSKMSRNSHSECDNNFDPDTEYLLNHSKDILNKTSDIDYFVYGHRHIPIKTKIPGHDVEFIYLGDWITHFSYGVFDGKEFRIEYYK
ncbi:MAG: UDP-2,3-diacylglucosamine diphosphatase [Deltaproteobacteria bacterium]